MASSSEEKVEQAQSIVAEFAGRLKPQLKAALQEGGPSKAIAVCSKQAPAIAQQLSESTGWVVKRVSDRNRNPNATPDTWEASSIKTLKTLKGQIAERLASPTFTYEETPEGFRYAQAQLTEGLCLTCHGEAIAAETQEALNEYYPDDLATGYKLGEVRGIISLLLPADSSVPAN
jgi:hypothetical protein